MELNIWDLLAYLTNAIQYKTKLLLLIDEIIILNEKNFKQEG